MLKALGCFYVLDYTQRAWSTVRKFMQLRSGILGVMQACNHLKDEMNKIRRKNNRQLTILQNFGLS